MIRNRNILNTQGVTPLTVLDSRSVINTRGLEFADQCLQSKSNKTPQIDVNKLPRQLPG